MYIHSFFHFHSGVMVFQVTQNVYSRLQLQLMSVVRECVLLQYIHSCFHSGVMVFQVTLNVYSQFRLSWMNDVRERVYPFIFTLM